jgi:hypothetical protein
LTLKRRTDEGIHGIVSLDNTQRAYSTVKERESRIINVEDERESIKRAENYFSSLLDTLDIGWGRCGVVALAKPIDEVGVGLISHRFGSFDHHSVVTTSAALAL